MKTPTAAERSCPSGPFWEGLQQGQFLLQHDAASGRHHFYAKPMYDSSGKPLPWKPAAGTGTVVAFTLSRVPGPGFEKLTPYLLALVQLDEGPRVFAPLTGCTPQAARIGLRARVQVAPADHPAPYLFQVET